MAALTRANLYALQMHQNTNNPPTTEARERKFKKIWGP
jgi:hypothetical protein